MTRRNFLLYSSVLTTTALNANLLYSDDIYLSPTEYSSLLHLDARLTKVKRYVGFGNFNLISYIDTLKIAKMNSKIGAFSSDELALIDRFFYENPAN